MANMVALEEMMEKTTGGAEVVHVIDGDTYKDRSAVIVTPTRGMVHIEVVTSWSNLLKPKNQRISHVFARNHEVGEAYNEMLKYILGHEKLSKYKYLITLEDDNIPPAGALIRMFDCMEQTDFDAVGLLYYTKGENPTPMAYGRPGDVLEDGVTMDFSPRDVDDAIMQGGLLEVNGIAMGCSIYRMEMFRDIPAPWFVTVNEWDIDAHKLVSGTSEDVTPHRVMTQDLSFCERARRAGKRFAVDCLMKVGHMDTETGTVY